MPKFQVVSVLVEKQDGRPRNTRLSLPDRPCLVHVSDKSRYHLGPTCTYSGYPDSTSDLSVTLPVGVFLRQQRIIGSRLNVPRAVDRARCNRMFARRGILPIQAPEFPCKVLVLTALDCGANPRSVVHADLDPLDRTSPGCSLDLITAAS